MTWTEIYFCIGIIVASLQFVACVDEAAQAHEVGCLLFAVMRGLLAG